MARKVITCFVFTGNTQIILIIMGFYYSLVRHDESNGGGAVIEKGVPIEAAWIALTGSLSQTKIILKMYG